MLTRISEYAHKAHILRQIQSNKAHRFSIVNNIHGGATIVVSSLLTFIGFSGSDKLKDYIGWISKVDTATMQLVFNLSVFVLLVLIIWHFVSRYPEKRSQAEQAIVRLSNLINEIEDILARSERGQIVEDSELQIVRHKYETIIQVIPPNSDHEHKRAKRDYKKKITKASGLALSSADTFDPDKQRQAIEALIRRSEVVMNVLNALRTVDRRLYLAGSLVRNLVWDHLHNYKASTPIDDVDIIYIDRLSDTKEHDEEIESNLRTAIPNYDWSVKNQHRMFAGSNEGDCESISEAVSRFPDTPSAFAIRLLDRDQLEIIAPLGFDDLFRLIIAPTPYCANKMKIYRDRVNEKNWNKTWPYLRALLNQDK